MWFVEYLFCGAWRPLANEEVLGEVALFSSREAAEQESSTYNEWDVRIRRYLS